MSERKSSFEDLECWKASRELYRELRKNTLPSFPQDEKFRLVDQIVRASRSVTANIAEGYGRYHYLDEAKFLSNPRGSLHEVLDHLITSKDDSYISETQLNDFRIKIDTAIRLLNGYRAYVLKRSKETY